MNHYKYNKYKKKYLNLLFLKGGASGASGTSEPTDVLGSDNIVKCVCGELFANNNDPMYHRSNVFTKDCDFKVQPCYKCGKHICIYCGDEVAPIFEKSRGEYSAHNLKGIEPEPGSTHAHFGWASPGNRPYNKGTWPRNSGWCLKRPDVTKYKTKLEGHGSSAVATGGPSFDVFVPQDETQLEEIRKAIEQVELFKKNEKKKGSR